MQAGSGMSMSDSGLMIAHEPLESIARESVDNPVLREP